MREKQTKTVEVKTSFMDLAYADYNKHVKPLEQTIKEIEETISSLCAEIPKTSGNDEEELKKVFRELNIRLPEVRMEADKARADHSPDLELISLAREIDRLDIYNQLINLYDDANKKLKECIPIMNKMIELGTYDTPLLVIKINEAFQESKRRFVKKDRVDLENKFYSRLDELDKKRKEKTNIHSKYSNKFKGVLVK